MQLADLFFNIRLQNGQGTLNSINQIGREFANLGKKVTNFGKSISSFGASLTKGITLPILGLSAAGVKYNMTMEDLQSNFKVLLGSEEKAIAMTAKLKKMGAETPFEVTGLADATKTLLSFGVNQKKVLPIMSKLGDVSLGNAERFKALNLVMGQVSANGKLQGQDLLQFINAGWNPLQQIIARTGETMSEVRDRMSKGKISVKEVEQALKDATSEGGRFYKGMEEGSKTLSGRLSTLKDNFMELLGNATKPLFDFISQKLVPLFTDLVQKFNNLSQPIKNIISIFALVAAAVGPAIFIFGGLVIAIGGVITAVGTIVGTISALISTLGVVLLPLTLVGGAFATLAAILATVGITYLVNKFGSLQGIFQALQAFIVNSLIPAFQFLASGEGLGKVNESAFITHDRLQRIRNIIVSIQDFILNSFVPALQYLATGEGLQKVKGASDGVKNALQLLRSKMVAVYDFVTNTLVPALQFLATGEGLGKVKDSSGDLRGELVLLRKKFIDVRNYIKNTLIPALIYLATGEGLNKVEGASKDAKEELQKMREGIKRLAKIITDFDSSSMVSNLSTLLGTINNVADAVGGLIGGIKTLMKLNPGYWLSKGSQALTDKLAGHADGIKNNPKGHFALTGEEGPELMWVPKHADIYTAQETRSLLSGMTNQKAMQPVNNKGKSESFIFNGNIMIDAKNIKEFNDIIDIFKDIPHYVNLRGGS